MRAAIVEEIGAPLVVEDVALRPPAEGGVIVRVAATAVCIIDALGAAGHVGTVPPAIPGHAGASVVEETGPRVESVRVGDRVVVCGTPECGRCYWCVRGRPDECAEMLGGIFPPRTIATRGDGSEVAADGGVGTYCERTNVREIGVVAVDSDLPDEVLCLLGCGVTTGLGAVFNIARVEPGASVAVVGCGHLGLWMIQAARVAGAAQVVAVEPRADRRAVAAALGATDLVDPAEGDERDLRMIATFATEDSAPPGVTIVREGDFSDEMVAIESGTADVIKHGRAVGTLGPGDVFGEIGVLDREIRTASVVATSPMRLIRLTSWDVGRLPKDVRDGMRELARTRRARDRAEEETSPAGS